MERVPDVKVRADVATGQWADPSTLGDVRVCEQHLLVEQRPGRDSRALQGVERLHDVLVRRPRADELVELVVMGEAVGRRGEARIVGELATSDHAGERRPLLIVGDGDPEPAVLAAAPVDTLRRVVGVTIAHAARLDAELAVDVDVAEMVHLVLQLRELDELTTAGGLAVMEAATTANAPADPVAASMYVVDGVSTSSLSW